ncbi:hypothetical protein [Halioxenophilus aromaticivorans]|uniref:Uncharacterized protein n=1 Tax=Halioxenophilus aromaticivorans TaxID=1306992 RepID=A0AAV3U4D9_9ALTE
MTTMNKSLLAATFGLLTTGTAIAGPLYSPDLVSDGNRWEITGYYDNAPGHIQAATQGICFYPDGISGTHQQYIWISDTFPDWNGRAVQEGDQIFMYGDFGEDKGHDSMTWEIVTSSPKNSGAGHWHEWLEDSNFGVTVGFGNSSFQRVGRCQIKSPDEALKVYQNIDYPRDETGNKITLPAGNRKGLDF